MDRIRQDAENLKGNRGEEFASGELAQVAAALAQADTLLGQNTVKEAFVKVSEADTALKAAMEKTYGALALEKLEAAKAALANMQKAEVPAEFAGDMETASSLVKYSAEDFESKSYLPSMTKSSDALALLNTITIAIEKKREEARIAGEKGVLPGEGRDLTGTPSDAAIPGEYVVRYNPKKRDCLWRIAHTVYRDARLWPLIYIANRDQIKDPDLIFPGQKFKIPPIPKKETVKEEKKEGDKPPGEAGKKQAGEKAE
jgi:nucleoid-associated protein YgaU